MFSQINVELVVEDFLQFQLLDDRFISAFLKGVFQLQSSWLSLYRRSYQLDTKFPLFTVENGSLI